MEKRKSLKKAKNKIVGDLWGSKESTTERYGKGFHWVENTIVKEYINNNITGDKNVDWVTNVFNKYFKKIYGITSCLSVGCGVGNLERHLCSLGHFKRFDAIDISEGALQQARENANKLGYQVSYKNGDLNKIRLPKKTYDVVFANMSLHHVDNLEHLLDQIENSMSDGALFIINEYVGPSQFQYTKKQVEIINDILELLPPMYRNRVTDKNVLKPFFAPPSVEYMNQNDPSEAIRSAEIINKVKDRFEDLEYRNFGGTILHMLLQDIIGNFDQENEKDMTVIRLILYIENKLIKEKVIDSDFTFMVLKKRDKSTDGFVKKFLSSIAR